MWFKSTKLYTLNELWTMQWDKEFFKVAFVFLSMISHKGTFMKNFRQFWTILDLPTLLLSPNPKKHMYLLLMNKYFIHKQCLTFLKKFLLSFLFFPFFRDITDVQFFLIYLPALSRFVQFCLRYLPTQKLDVLYERYLSISINF